MAVRLNAVRPEYAGRVRLRTRPFPLEIGGDPAPRDILDQEWWLAALQEPLAEFAPYQGDDWPTTTLPAFEAAWAAVQQGEAAGHDYDLRVRRAFFAQGRNIGRRAVLLDLAKEAGLDLAQETGLDLERSAATSRARRGVPPSWPSGSWVRDATPSTARSR